MTTKNKISLYDCNYCKWVGTCEFIYDKGDSIPCSSYNLMDIDQIEAS